MAVTKPAKPAKLKLTFAGRGKRKPTLPEGEHGVLTINGHALRVAKIGGSTMFALPDLVGDARTAKSIAATQIAAGRAQQVPVHIAAEGMVKAKTIKTVFVNLNAAVLASATQLACQGGANTAALYLATTALKEGFKSLTAALNNPELGLS